MIFKFLYNHPDCFKYQRDDNDTPIRDAFKAQSGL